MTRASLSCSVALLLGTACASPGGGEEAPPRPESEILPAHLAYLDHLAEAERLLEESDFDGAIAAAERACEQPVQNWYDLERFFGEAPAPHATAHFTRARALVASDQDAAMASLRSAAEAGYSDKSRIVSDPWLAPLHRRGDWSEVLAGFRDEDATDDLAGRTVASFEEGMRVVVGRANNHPKLGERAPDFEAGLADGSGTLRLSELCHEKPVVLVFGSFT